jgi:malonyl CoA-acyl carrier protein transacylase
VISNLHAKPYEFERIKTDLADQITHPVRWQQSMEYLLECGVEIFEEIGNGDVMTKLMASIRSHFAINMDIKKADQPNSMPLQAVSPIGVLLSQVNNWNEQHKVGDKVNVQGGHQGLHTRTEAKILFGQKAVIYLEDYKGYFELDQVTAVN